MKKAFSFVLLVLIVCMLVPACSDKASTNALPNQDIPVENPDTPAPSSKKAVVTASFANEDITPDYAAENSEYAVNVSFSTTAAVKDFTFFSFDADSFINYSAYKIGKELYTKSNFTPDNPIVISLALPETIPFNGVCFTNSDGTCEYYYISVSGKDGSLIFESFLPNSKAF